MSKDLVGKTYWKGKQINFTSNEKKETIKKKILKRPRIRGRKLKLTLKEIFANMKK